MGIWVYECMGELRAERKRNGLIVYLLCIVSIFMVIYCRRHEENLSLNLFDLSYWLTTMRKGETTKKEGRRRAGKGTMQLSL